MSDSSPPRGEITMLLEQVGRGEGAAADRLMGLVYEELRHVALAKMSREAPGRTLQATALVHEAWLRLGGDAQPAWNNRAHFFAAASEAMRRILIEAARKRQAARHGGGLQRAEGDAEILAVAAPAADEELLRLHEALAAFAAQEPRKAELVKLKYFGGLTLEEAAGVLGISLRSAERDWTFARAWLFNEVGRQKQ